MSTYPECVRESSISQEIDSAKLEIGISQCKHTPKKKENRMYKKAWILYITTYIYTPESKNIQRDVQHAF
jgi:hypothetical protein